MAQIYSLNDLVSLGTLNKGTLVMNTEVLLKFQQNIEIPYQIKIRGNTVISGGDGVTINFTGEKSPLVASSNGTSLTLRNVEVKSKAPLFDIRRNTINRLTLDFVNANVPSLGSANFRILHIFGSKFVNKDQEPLEIGSCNCVMVLETESSSLNPLMNIQEISSIRESLVVRQFEDKNNGGLINIGTCAPDNTYMLADISLRGILVRRISSRQPRELLRVKANGVYKVPNLEVVKSLFG